MAPQPSNVDRSRSADPSSNELRNPGPPAGVSAIQKEGDMDTTTLLIIIVVLLVLGGGWYGRGRWYYFAWEPFLNVVWKKDLQWRVERREAPPAQHGTSP